MNSFCWLKSLKYLNSFLRLCCSLECNSWSHFSCWNRNRSICTVTSATHATLVLEVLPTSRCCQIWGCYSAVQMTLIRIVVCNCLYQPHWRRYEFAVAHFVFTREYRNIRLWKCDGHNNKPITKLIRTIPKKISQDF